MILIDKNINDKMQAKTDYLSYGYALSVVAGGVIGFFKAGSLPSLFAGLLFGGLAGYGGYNTSRNLRHVGYGLAASAFLLTFMGYRYLNSGKFLPAGLVAVLSFFQIIHLLVKYYIS